MAKRCCRIYDFLIIDATAPPLLMVFCSVFAPDHGNLFYLFALRPPFQSKHQVGAALKNPL